jgi:nitrite reductase (NADH) small subunit
VTLDDLWQVVCNVEEILPDTGVCADVGGRQVAIFCVDGAIYALDNFDPASSANVLSRGIIGELGGEIVVASPMYKHHFSLATGLCLEEPNFSVDTYPARLVERQVWIRAQAIRHRRSLEKSFRAPPVIPLPGRGTQAP